MFENPKKVTSKDLSEPSIDHLYTSLQNSLSTKKATQKRLPSFKWLLQFVKLPDY